MSSSSTPPASTARPRVYPHFDDLVAGLERDAPHHVSVKKWLEEGQTRLQRVQFNRSIKRADSAYTDFMIAADILITKIPQDKEFPTFASASPPSYRLYRDLQKAVMEDISSGKVEALKDEIKENNRIHGTVSLSNNVAIILPEANNTGSKKQLRTDVNGGNGELQGGGSVKKKAPPPPPSKPAALSTYRLSTGGKSNGTQQSINTSRPTSPETHELSKELEARFEKLKLNGSISRLPAQKSSPGPTSTLGGRSTDVIISRGRSPATKVLPTPGRLDTGISAGLPRPPSPTYSPSRNSISPPRSMPVKPVQKSSTSQIPLTNETTISPSVLFSYMSRSTEISVLLLDVRNRAEYDEGHIPAKSVVCVEPLSLRPGISGDALEESFHISPSPTEHDLFSQRHNFDLIVYHDQSTASNDFITQNTDDEKLIHLQRLHLALCEFSYDKPLKRPPVLLKGGLHAWLEDFGPPSLKSSDSQPSAVGLGITNLSRPVEDSSLTSKPQQASSPSKDSTFIDIDIEEEKAWLARLQSNREPLTISVPKDAENMDVKRQRRSTSIVSAGEAYPIVPPPEKYPRTVEQFFSRFPASPNFQQQSMMTPIPGTPASAGLHTPTTPGFSTKRNTILDHPFYGFTDVRNPEFNPLPSPVRPPPAVPRKSYKGESEKPVVRPMLDQQLALKGMPQTGSPFATGKIGGMNIGATGLKNLGNTCYMNSILQCMNGTIPLSRYFLDGSYKMHINKENELGSRGELAEAFANVVRHLWEGRYKFISPMTFKDISGRLNEMFKTNDQQDAQEFLEFLLDGLHEDLNPHASRNKLRDLTPEDEANRERLSVPVAAFNEWRRYTHRNSSVIVNWFQGQLSSRLKCLTCNTRSTTYSPFTYLSVPIPPKKNPTIHDCIEEFCREETLEKDDAWHCPTCKKPRKATKKLTITRLPLLLIVHIKRFTNKGPWRDKLNTPIGYPLKDLDLTKYVLAMPLGMMVDGCPAPAEQTPPFVYALYGVCNHYGTLNGGHYTSFVRNSYDEAWNLFDDSKVSRISPEDVSSKNAYVLFWVRSHVM